MDRLDRRVLMGFAAALAGVGSLSLAPPAHAATLTVANCNDSGPGSLRATIASAASGDVVDLRALSCSVIRTTSALDIPQQSLTLQGPGYKRLSVDINWSDSVLRHTGTGTLRIRGLRILHGTRRTQSALGGCVYSSGNVDVQDVSISNCGALASGASPTVGLGGGIYAAGDVAVRYSAIRSSSARGGTARGGAIYAGGKVTLLRAQITTSNAARGGGVYANEGLEARTTTFAQNFANRDGAAMFLLAPAMLVDSTVSGNTSNGRGAGFWGENSAAAVTIVNSTLSGNRAVAWSAGWSWGGVALANTTVAFNLEWPADIGGATECQSGAVGGTDVHLESSILSDTSCVIDFQPQPWFDVMADQSLTGSDNLIRLYSGGFLPDTIDADPLLAPLANNGGRTLTHLPASGSPVIDAGNNAAGLVTDQRGAGFPRVKGVRADIGAIER